MIAKTRPVLEISRLLLRPPREEDFDAYAETVADPEVMRFLGGPLDRGRAWRVFATMAGHWSLRGYGPFSIIRKSDGRWIGRAGPWTPEGSPGTEVGWLITRQAQGHGYAREAVTAAIDWAFNALDWREVLHCIEPENAPSIRFAESLGASYSRDVRDLPGIGYSGVWRVYAQSRSAWRTRSNAPAP